MADSSVPDPVLVEKKEGYAVVTLNDPDRRNVFTLAMNARVHEIFDDLEADEGINAVVITGAGKGFCSGGHLDELLEHPGPEGMRKIYAGFVRIGVTLLQQPSCTVFNVLLHYYPVVAPGFLVGAAIALRTPEVHLQHAIATGCEKLSEVIKTF